MSKNEIALQLTLSMIEKGFILTSGDSDAAIGQHVVDLYNTIVNGIDVRENTPEGNPATFG